MKYVAIPPDRALWVGILSLLLLALAGCATTGGEGRSSVRHYTPSDVFPVPDALHDNVEFWRNVYGVWSRSEVAFHDEKHLGVIYEVVRLPGSTTDGYSGTQKGWLKSRHAYHVARLSRIEQRLRANQPLDRDDQQLLAKLEQAGGKGAIYGAAERVRSQRGLRERFRRGVEISGRYDAAFRDVMRQHGVPEDLAYLPHVESSFQTNARSSVGAGGVWQFMPSTGRQYMRVDRLIDERYDPILAAEAAARYLAQAYRRLGSWPLAITSYNHGQGGMANAKAQYGDDIGRIVSDYRGKYFGFASRNFYAEFMAAREVASNARNYFPEGIRYEEPWVHDRLVLQHSLPVDQVARHYGTSTSQLAALNLHWADSVRSGRANIPAGSRLWVPAGLTQRVAGQPRPASRSVALIAASAPAPRSSAGSVAKSVTAAPRVAAATPAKSTQSKAAPAKVAAAKSPTKTPQTAATNGRYHVVKPQETLYRVALINGLSVAELRRLNAMDAGDTRIRPGQRLRVGI